MPFEAGKLLEVFAGVALTFIYVGFLSPPPIPDATADEPAPIPEDCLIVFARDKGYRSL